MSARAPSALLDAIGISMKPACETDEYASIRFTFSCASAAMFPIASETQAIAAIAQVHRYASCGNAVTSTRSATTSAATFVADDMNAVTGVGAPWYASGVHMWNGAAEALNPSPAITMARPTTKSGAWPGPAGPVLWKSIGALAQ